MPPPILILGATSAIAKACAHKFAKEGYPLYLAGRDERELQRIANDVNIRWGVPVKFGYFEASDFDAHALFFERVVTEMPDLATVLLAFGYQGDSSNTDFNEMKKLIDINYGGACSILTYVANYFSKQRRGIILAITSVAGDRGRQSNYRYGSTKAALNTYLEGLCNKMHPFGVRVITIKPGFVDTPMTFGKKGIFLVASPESIANGIFKHQNGYRDVIYLPWFWRYILDIICAIPNWIFKRMKL